MAKTKKEAKHAGGRPTKYRSEFCGLLIRHAHEGALTFESFCGYLYFRTGIIVNVDTLYEWEKVHPEFSDAKKAAHSIRRENWERIGSEAMRGKIHGFNVTAWIFIGKNCHGWKDKHEISGTGENGEIEVKVKRDRIKGILSDPQLAEAAFAIADAFSGDDD